MTPDVTTRSRGAASALLPWAVWGLAALFYCYAFFQRVAPSVMVDPLMRDFAAGGALLGNLSAFYFYAYAGLQVPVGVLTDRLGPRLMMTGAALLCAGGSLLFAVADSLTVAYLGRLLVGAGSATCWVGALKLLSVWFPPRRFAALTGVTLMMGTLGAVGGQAPLAALVQATGWRDTMIGAGFAALVIALAIWLVVRDRPEEGPASTGDGQTMGDLLRGLRSVLTMPQNWAIAVYGLATGIVPLTFGSLWGVPFLMQVYGLDRTEAAGTTSAMLVGFGIGGPLVGWISDRIGRRRSPMLVTTAITFATMAAATLIPNLPILVLTALIAVGGAAAGSVVLIFSTAREHNRPERIGAVLGFVNMMLMSSGAIGQLLVGVLLDAAWAGETVGGARVYSPSAWRFALATLPVFQVVAFLMALSVRETFCRPLQPESSVERP